MIELRWIGIRSSARVAASIGAAFGLFLGIALFALSASQYGLAVGLAVFIITLVGLPIVAVVVVEFGIVLYDIAARILGGAGLEIKNDEVKKIDLTSYLRIAVPLNILYLGFCFAAMFYLSHSGGLHSLYLSLYPVLVAAGVSSLNGIVDPAVYDFIVPKIGGIKFKLRKGVIKSIDVRAGAKIGSLLIAFNYIFFTFVTTSASVLKIGLPVLQQSYPIFLGPYLGFVAYVVLYLIGGYVGAAVVLWLYNKVVSFVGCIEMDTKPSKA